MRGSDGAALLCAIAGIAASEITATAANASVVIVFKVSLPDRLVVLGK
jgi:hypothetical protein